MTRNAFRNVTRLEMAKKTDILLLMSSVNHPTQLIFNKAMKDEKDSQNSIY